MRGFDLHLLRHGVPEIVGSMLGRTDCRSTPAGIASCVTRGRDLAVEAIVTSDLRRARDAGIALAAEHQLAATVDPRWRELDFGDWDGLASTMIDGPALAAFWDDPDANPPPQGERWSALVARVGAAIADLPSRPTLVVTHGGTIRAAVASLCGLDHRQVWSLDLPYAALLSLRIWPGPQPAAQIFGLVR